MGDDRWKEGTPLERMSGVEPVRPTPASKVNAASKAIQVARPWLARGIALAKTVPGHLRDLAEWIDAPRRLDQSRQWLEEQDFPEKARKAQALVAKAGGQVASASRRAAASAQARIGPMLLTTGRKSVAAARVIGQTMAVRSSALTKLLAERKAMLAAVAVEKAAALKARDRVGDAEAATAPVPSELMRLLKEEGIAVDGLDVRQALPEPIRSRAAPAQGALPLFADDPTWSTKGHAQMQPRVKEDRIVPKSPPPSPQETSPSEVVPQPESWRAALKRLGKALLNSTSGTVFYNNRIFQMTIGATIFLAAAGAAVLMVSGGSSSTSDIARPAGQMDRSQVEAIVRNYILAHPEIIPEAMEKLQSKRTASMIDQHRTELETPFAGGWDGARNGDVVLVEFFDYACGYCKASLPDIDRLLAEDKQLKVVYRELPILSEESNAGAKVSLYAAKQGQYGAFHRALYAAGLSKQGIEAAAKKVGLDPSKLKGATQASDISAEIANNIRLAQSLQATGTPTWVVGDQLLSGAVGYDALKEAIARVRLSRQ